MRRLSIDEASRLASSSYSTAFSTYSSCLVMGPPMFTPVQPLNRKNEKGVNGFRHLRRPIAQPPACAVPRRARPCRPRTKRRGSIQARAAPYPPRPCEPFVVSVRELSVSNGRSREALPRKTVAFAARAAPLGIRSAIKMEASWYLRACSPWRCPFRR